MTHVSTDNIVMRVILQNNTDWDCFKTLTSREILKIRNSLLEEHCASSEVIRSGQPDRLSPTGYSKEDYGQSWSSQEWKSGAAAHDRSGKPEKTSWDMMQQVAPHREEPLLDGNAHSVRYGGMLHDRPGQLDNANSQEEADSETFVM